MSIGQIFDDRYGIQKCLGAGGFATVYLVYDYSLNRTAALKVLRKDLSDTEGARRLLQEARIICSLSHPNIVTCHRIAEHNGQIYLDLEYFEGQTLLSLIESEGKLPLEYTAHVVEQTAAALSCAHKYGVIHRDLSTRNILIGRSHETAGQLPQVKIIDFGLSKLTDALSEQGLTKSREVLGTIYYISPEQYNGGPVDSTTDVFALGAIAYHALTGEPPLIAASPYGIALASANNAKTDDSVAASLVELPSIDNVPSGINRVVRQSMEFNVLDRYASIASFAESFRNAATEVAGLGPIASAGGPSLASVRKAGRWSALIVIAGLGLLSVLLIGGPCRYFLFGIIPSRALMKLCCCTASALDCFGFPGLARSTLVDAEKSLQGRNNADTAFCTVMADHAKLCAKQHADAEANVLAATTIHRLAMEKVAGPSECDIVKTCCSLLNGKGREPGSGESDCITLAERDPVCRKVLVQTAFKIADTKLAFQPEQRTRFYLQTVSALAPLVQDKTELLYIPLARCVAEDKCESATMVYAAMACASANNFTALAMIVPCLQRRDLSNSPAIQAQRLRILAKYARAHLKNPRLCEQHLEKGISIVDSLPKSDTNIQALRDMRFELCDLLYTTGDIEQADTVRLLRNDKGDQNAQLLVQRFYALVKTKRFAEAEAQVDELLKLPKLPQLSVIHFLCLGLDLARDTQDTRIAAKYAASLQALKTSTPQKVLSLTKIAHTYLALRDDRSANAFAKEGVSLMYQLPHPAESLKSAAAGVLVVSTINLGSDPEKGDLALVQKEPGATRVLIDYLLINAHDLAKKKLYAKADERCQIALHCVNHLPIKMSSAKTLRENHGLSLVTDAASGKTTDRSTLYRDILSAQGDILAEWRDNCRRSGRLNQALLLTGRIADLKSGLQSAEADLPKTGQ